MPNVDKPAHTRLLLRAGKETDLGTQYLRGDALQKINPGYARRSVDFF